MIAKQYFMFNKTDIPKKKYPVTASVFELNRYQGLLLNQLFLNKGNSTKTIVQTGKEKWTVQLKKFEKH